MENGELNYNKGQSIIEYSVLFVIALAGLYLLATRIPGIFGSYVASATGAMK